jgi:hypothetical protein
LFAAFGGFLTKVAPPTAANSEYVVGFGSFLVLIILIAISALTLSAPPKKLWRKWMIGGTFFFVLALASGLVYPWTLSHLTYAYPPPPDAPVGYHVAGYSYELTETAKEFLTNNPQMNSPGELELNLPYEEIWTPGSVETSKFLLQANYLLLLISISTSIFCFLEANVKNAPRPRPRKTKPVTR